MDGMSTFTSEVDQEQIERARKDQLVFEKELLEKKLQYTKELESAHSSAENQDGSKQNSAPAKLPKLTITKFNGTNIDWTRFGGQFTDGIDKSEMAQSTGLLSVLVKLDAKFAQEDFFFFFFYWFISTHTTSLKKKKKRIHAHTKKKKKKKKKKEKIE